MICVSEENKEEQAVSEEKVEESLVGAQEESAQGIPEEAAAAEASADSAAEESSPGDSGEGNPSESEESGETGEDEPESSEEDLEDEEGEGGPRERRREGRKSIADLPKPVKVGDEIEVEIESVGAKGDGIAKKDGFVIFVPGVQRGDTVKIRIAELKTSFAIGEKV